VELPRSLSTRTVTGVCRLAGGHEGEACVDKGPRTQTHRYTASRTTLTKAIPRGHGPWASRPVGNPHRHKRVACVLVGDWASVAGATSSRGRYVPHTHVSKRGNIPGSGSLWYMPVPPSCSSTSSSTTSASSGRLDSIQNAPLSANVQRLTPMVGGLVCCASPLAAAPCHPALYAAQHRRNY
jgi:hypothetical protein